MPNIEEFRPRLDFAGARRGALWALAGFASFAVMALGFFRCAPWLVAMSVADAELQWPGQIDASWHAVVNNHGQPAAWDHGTIADNPLGFAAWLLVLLVGAGGWLYCFRQARRSSER